jgi:prevent-host-death family protein
MARIVTSDDLRARLGRELDALRETEEALYVSKRGRLAAVILDAEHYAQLVERLDYLEDSLAALRAREERELAVLWDEVREPRR